MEKVLIGDKTGNIHYIDKDFLSARYTICSMRLHPIDTRRVSNKYTVTCSTCCKKYYEHT